MNRVDRLMMVAQVAGSDLYKEAFVGAIARTGLSLGMKAVGAGVRGVGAVGKAGVQQIVKPKAKAPSASLIKRYRTLRRGGSSPTMARANIAGKRAVVGTTMTAGTTVPFMSPEAKRRAQTIL